MADKSIKRVTLFETPDGQRHDTHARARRMCDRAQARQELSDFVVKHGSWGGPGPSSDEVTDFILQNCALLHHIVRKWWQ